MQKIRSISPRYALFRAPTKNRGSDFKKTLQGRARMKGGYILPEIKKDTAAIYAAMLKVGLDPCARKKVCNYSLGMRQRLAIAQATMEDQQILILDEPMNGLDKEGVAEMRKFFSDQKRMGKLILLASHNKEDIELLCDEVYEMDHGTLKKINETEDLQVQKNI